MPRIRAVTHLDRQSGRRKDKDWMATQAARPDARIMLLIDLKPAIVSNETQTEASLRWFSSEHIAGLKLERFPATFLGTDEAGAPYYCLPITEHHARLVPGGPFCLKPYVDVRTLAVQAVMTPAEVSLAAEARAISAWHLASRCCGHCGSTTDIKDGGWRRSCWSCGQDHFPRTDPAVIMLVTDGDRCVLGHEARFAEKFHSTLAGFVEPGEDIEGAVRREVEEEVGIKIGKVSYQESQPWPFPHSLMIGCRAEALTTELNIDPDEIEDARWFTRDEVRLMLAGTHPAGMTVPGPHSVAYKLIKTWADEDR